jgi:hypothetical protein
LKRDRGFYEDWDKKGVENVIPNNADIAQKFI